MTMLHTSPVRFSAPANLAAGKVQPRFGEDKKAEKPEEKKGEPQPCKKPLIDRLPRPLQVLAAAGMLVGYLTTEGSKNVAKKYRLSKEAPGRTISMHTELRRNKAGELYATAYERSSVFGGSPLHDYYTLDVEPDNADLKEVLANVKPGYGYRITGTVSQPPGFFTSKGRMKVERIELTFIPPKDGKPGMIGGSEQLYPKPAKV